MEWNVSSLSPTRLSCFSSSSHSKFHVCTCRSSPVYLFVWSNVRISHAINTSITQFIMKYNDVFHLIGLRDCILCFQSQSTRCLKAPPNNLINNTWGSMMDVGASFKKVGGSFKHLVNWDWKHNTSKWCILEGVLFIIKNIRFSIGYVLLLLFRRLTSGY